MYLITKETTRPSNDTRISTCKKIMMNTDHINNKRKYSKCKCTYVMYCTAIVNRHALCNRFMIYVCLNLFNHVSVSQRRKDSLLSLGSSKGFFHINLNNSVSFSLSVSPMACLLKVVKQFSL